jgi:ZIP family zinc transporter
MLDAFALGALSQLSLGLSGLAVFLIAVPKRVVGALAGFGAGALIAAVARDLLPEAHTLQLIQSSLWAMLGAGVFFVAEHYVDEKFERRGASGALGIVVGSIVDGVPNRSFGIQLASGEPVSAPSGAVFVSNIPQAVAPSADLSATGWSWRRWPGSGPGSFWPAASPRSPDLRSGQPCRGWMVPGWLPLPPAASWPCCRIR